MFIKFTFQKVNEGGYITEVKDCVKKKLGDDMDDKRQRYADLFGRYSGEQMRRFLKFHHDNPAVYKEFKRLAKQWKDSGKNRCSAALLGNVLRWHVSLETTDEEFRINNNWLPLFARMLAFQHSEYLDFFVFR